MTSDRTDPSHSAEASAAEVFRGHPQRRLFDKCRNYSRAKEAKAAGVYPYFIPVSENHSSEVVIDGRTLVMAGSNNYLGLVQDPRVKEASINAIRSHGIGCTGSRFLNGTLRLHVELEERLAQFYNRQAALTFSTGFQANQGVISTLVDKNDVLFLDREDHASIYEGARLSFGAVRKFRHNDMDELEKKLSLNDKGHGKLIIVDGVFSMSGDLVNLPRLVELANEYDASIMVDDAHSVGVMGPTGRGTPEHFGLESEVDLILGTFSKSFASLGGYVVGDEDVIHYIKHTARALIFSASITPASVAGVLAALDIIENEPERRDQLWKNREKVKGGLDSMGFDTLTSETPVIPVLIGEDMQTMLFWKALFDGGVYTNAVIPPAVAPNHGLIRTSLMATHTEAQLDRMLEIFEKVGKSMGVI